MYEGQDVLVNGVPFNRIDEAGNRWILSDLDGWWGLPDANVPDDPRPFQDDGSYFSTGRYEARQIVLSGVIVPGSGAGNPTAAALGAASARNSLNRAMSLVRSTAILQVNETLNGGPKIASVQLVAKPLTRFNDSRNVLEFNFQLRAADPRKYALDPTISTANLESSAEGRTYDRTFDYVYGAAGSGGLMTVDNAGSYNTFGVIRINGPVVHPSIEHLELGRTISIDITLGSDEYLEINLKDRTILLGGSASRRNKLDPSSKWFWFLPGENTLRFTGYQVNQPRPEFPAAENYATNPSFETSWGTASSRINGTANPRAITGLTDWAYTAGTGETGLLVAAGGDTSPAGVQVRENRARSPRAIGTISGVVSGYGGSIANFGTFINGTSQLTALVTPGLSFITRTSYTRDPRASQGYSVAGTGWTYEKGTSEASFSVSTTQDAVTRTNLYRNPKFVAPDSNVGTYFTASSDEDPFLGTCYTIVRTDGLGANTFGAGLRDWTYAPNTEYTVTITVRAVGQDLTGPTVIPVYIRPVGQASSTGQTLLGTIDQPVGDPVTYVFHGTSTATAASAPAITLVSPTVWGEPSSAIMVTNVLVETGNTLGIFFWGDSPEENLELDRHVLYRWAGGENTSNSEAVESIQQLAEGPVGVSGFIRQYLTKPKSAGTSGWTYYDTAATLNAVLGDRGTASIYARSTEAISVQLRLERLTGAGVVVGTAETSTLVTLVPGVWTRVSITDTVDGIAAQFRAQLQIVADAVSTNMPHGSLVDVTALLMEKGIELRDYFDGSFSDISLPFDRTVDFSWSGTEGDSTSLQGETITPDPDGGGSNVIGPIEGINSFARAVIVEPKTTGTSGWAGRDAATTTPATVLTGQRWTVSMYVRYAGEDTEMPITFRMEYQTVAGTSAASFDSAPILLPAGDWVRISISGIAAGNYSYIGWSIRDTTTAGPPANSIVDVTGLLIEKARVSADTSVGAYFDGSTNDTEMSLDRVHVYSWSSTVNASPSIAELTVLSSSSGPLGIEGYARWMALTDKTALTSDLYYHSAVAAASGTTSTPVVGSLWVRSSADVDVIPQVILYNNAAVVNTFTGGTPVALLDTAWHRISFSGTASGTFNRVRVVARLTSGEILHFGDVFDASSVLVDVGVSTLRSYFDGDISDTGVDGVLDWSGTDNASQSTLTVQGVKTFGPVSLPIASNNGTYQTAFQATTWSVIGSRALGHTVTASPSAETYVTPAGTASGLTRLNMVPGEAYTISAYLYVPATQTGTLSANARRIALVVTAPSLGGGTQTIYSDQAANVPGTSRLQLSTTLPVDTTNVELRLMHGATSGTVFWDGVMIEPGLFMSADYFDGDSEFGEWLGTAHDSTSSRPFIPEIRGSTAEVMMRSAWIE